MKRIVVAVCMVLVVLLTTSCNKDNEYAGTYSGTFSMTGTEKTVNGNLIFTAGVNDSENLYLYGMKMTKESDAKYISNTATLSRIVAMISTDSADQIENVSATFEFSNNRVDMKLQYNLLGSIDITIITFTGTKLLKE
ncbi:MAG: hypothetical protein LBV02_05830 [Bacteroidales bacterium]|nr:hypothetical protein [Bacteroidales bacterium]